MIGRSERRQVYHGQPTFQIAALARTQDDVENRDVGNIIEFCWDNMTQSYRPFQVGCPLPEHSNLGLTNELSEL